MYWIGIIVGATATGILSLLAFGIPETEGVRLMRGFSAGVFWAMAWMYIWRVLLGYPLPWERK